MKISGDFLGDLEQLQEFYESKFVHYSSLHGLDRKQKKKYESYYNCSLSMEWLMKLFNKHQDEYWKLIRSKKRIRENADGNISNGAGF